MEPNALSLSRDCSALSERFLEKLEVRLLKERVGGSNGVGRIGDDNVPFVLLVVEVLESVTDEDSDTRIVKAGSHVREERLRNTRNSFVDVAKSSGLDLRVLEDLTKDSSISSSDDENLFGIGVGSERKVGDHFLVTIREYEKSVRHSAN